MARLWAHGVKGIQRQNERIWKVVWETMKGAHIVEKYEDQEDDEIKTFHTPPNSPTKLSWPIGIAKLLTLQYAWLMFDLHMQIYDAH